MSPLSSPGCSSSCGGCGRRTSRREHTRKSFAPLTISRRHRMSTSTEVALFPYDDAVAAFDPVLGLEVHVELGTESKMFCGCPTEFGAEPNSQVCPTCLGLPGSLPVLNRAAVESTIRVGLALHCSIATWCRFAR